MAIPYLDVELLAPVVQLVRGSLGAHEQGLIITTSDFSAGAIKCHRALLWSQSRGGIKEPPAGHLGSATCQGRLSGSKFVDFALPKLLSPSNFRSGGQDGQSEVRCARVTECDCQDAAGIDGQGHGRTSSR
jgi:hypothetical protein